MNNGCLRNTAYRSPAQVRRDLVGLDAGRVDANTVKPLSKKTGGRLKRFCNPLAPDVFSRGLGIAKQYCRIKVIDDTVLQC